MIWTVATAVSVIRRLSNRSWVQGVPTRVDGSGIRE